MRFVLFFSLLVISIGLTGQESLITVHGHIRNAVTGEPIENANVSIKGSNKGSTSNELGEFSITICNLPFTLSVTHVSYRSSVTEYHSPPIRKLQINLEPEIREIQGITITSQKIDTLYKDNIYSVLDYELVGDNILLLIFRDRITRAELLLMNRKGKTVISLKVLPGKPLALYTDCLDSTHLITKHKVFQLSTNNKKIALYKPVSLDFFKEVMEGCLFKTGTKLYFEKYSWNHLSKTVYWVDPDNRSNHILREISDIEKINFLLDNPENNAIFIGGSEPGLADLKGLPGDAGALAAIRNLDITRRFNQMAYLSEIHAPVFKLGDSVCIFNYPNNQIEMYGPSDSLVFKTNISYHLSPKKNPLESLGYAFVKATKWEGNIIVDEKRKRVYALFKNINGTRDIKEIDLLSGKTKHVTSIPFPYVEKIKIKNNEIFYIYKGWGQNQKKKLFRQKLIYPF
ncbi:MAG: carboxypeptidase-like regulatory domain-containing protein [Bacteroidales bacterium]|nr:carboxypeptidase-like regulatory domain-containing protein [Bacteroidales bacterium]